MSDYNPNIPPKKRPFPFSMQLDPSKFELASDEEKAQQDVMRESTTFFRDGMRKLFRNPLAVASMIVLIIILITIVIAPLIVPYSYSNMITINGKRDKSAKNLPPFTYSKLEQQAIDEGQYVFPHIFGTDELCRDYFIRVIYGARVSLAVGFFASLIVLFIGLLYGSIAGYAGGKTDLIMMRIVDIIYSLPDTLMVILLSVVLDQLLGQSLQGTVLASIGPNMLSMFAVFGLLYWVGMARLVRGQILTDTGRVTEGEVLFKGENILNYTPQHPAGIQVIGDAVDGFDFTGVRKEGGMEVFDLKQWRFTHTITSLTWGRRRHGDRRPGG